MSEKDIKDAIKEKKIVIGSKSVIKNVKNNLLNSVFYAENCNEDLLAQLKHYSKISGVEIKKFDGTSENLGELCAKPFNILVIGIKK
ncbi:MAG: ribosomal L7Ae/L30e/S12e/Gadd45 family protein [Nanoarchaeota archaeon]|nr:ribosomal L7Ae/L30e/S12e/Gadd45 family protein [Nanoarchaeota archaeon]MBU1135255.1 ribosomal L7Ae/L30e/S12e/Gadd45 family protein [Nanoarchaeota archaeon]MBU2519895.1 ribosomal L7Ae/L30e/S12e/Gadd45 family protein [Nanoarchaeota archaeon]